jgi:ABC-type lipoprotein export system ATPase subunit
MLKLPSRQSTKEANDGEGNHPAEHLISLSNIIKAYKTEAGDFIALRDVNLTIGNGEFVAVIGKSGSGKSTLINMIAGIDRPTAGEVYIAGISIRSLNESKMAKLRGHSLGIVFQFFQLLPLLTAAENIMLPMDFCNIYSRQERRKRAIHLLDLVGLARHADKLPSMLSGGEQQRVAIARALANDPPIILADEPTGNLDSKTSEVVFQVFEELVTSGKTILMVTHDNDLAKRAKRTIHIADGEIFEDYLARAFPSLTQKQLIWATSRMEFHRYPAGSIIVRKGEPADKFYLVIEGRAEVVMDSEDGEGVIAAHIESGQHFGEIELLRGGNNIATIHAPIDQDIEVATLDSDSFNRLITESEPTRQEICAVAEQRLKENAENNRQDNNA